METSVVRPGTERQLAPSVRKTLSNTFLTVGVMMALTAGTSVFTMGVTLSLWVYLACFVGSLALIFATHRFRNSAMGLVMLAAFSVLEGITLGPLMGHYLALKNGATLVGMSAGLTAMAALACAAYVKTSKRDFSRWGGFLLAGTLVLLVAMLVGLFVPMPAFQLTISAVAAVLFVGWLVFDIGRIVKGEETNYISASLSIYLDLLNLFLHLLRLLGFVGGED